MMALEEALRYVQIGFYLGLGALGPLAIAARAARAWVHVEGPHVEAPDIHCAECCPSFEQ